MGCDIHLYLEKRVYRYDDKEKKNGIWVNADKWTRNHRLALYPDDEDERNEWELDYHDRIYTGRNYDLFAILANVRNGYGFAGVPTGSGFVPIAMPKCFPEDVSLTVKRESDGWGCDGHSHSWFTLKELLDYDWEQGVTEHQGVVSAEEYKVFKKEGKPKSWCGMISGVGIEFISNEEMDQYIEGTSDLPSEMEHELSEEEGAEATKTKVKCRYYTTIQWKEGYKACCRHFVEETIPKLQNMVGTEWGKLVPEPEDLRIVFWFDN
jgi:hypothetical protein